MARGLLRRLVDGLHTLERRFKEAGARSSSRPGVTSPRTSSTSSRGWRSWVISLGGLDGVFRRAIEDSSRALATEAVQFALPSLWSRVPDLPVEEVLEGVIQGYKDEVRARTLAVAREVLNTFAPARRASLAALEHPGVFSGEVCAT